MALAAGSSVGPYEILSPLGVGGMGEVYRARDTRLGRTVAIKVLPAHVAADPDRRLRFEREARAISALNHPHICTLYDIGHQDGIDFLVMEYVDGATLAARLATGPLSVPQTLVYGGEIAEALDKAHRQGIVHRDLKPGNIMLTKGGVKLLDFGLAKLRGDAPPMDGLTRTVPVGAAQGGPLTGQGTIVGTLQYMAPEQLEGKEADARADMFAFGAVLYEMLTGRKAFEGASQASVISAIMSSDPPALAALQPLTPPALDRVIRTCLMKDRDDRWASVHDVLLQLQWIAQDRSAAATPAGSVARLRRERLAWLAAAIAVLIAAMLWLSSLRRPTTDLPTYVLSALAPHGAALAEEEAPAISPDGRRLAFVGHDATGRRLLYTRALDASAAPQALADTDGASLPFWSPDSQFVAFFGQAKLKTVDVATGRVQTLADAAGARGGTWNQDGVIVFVPRPADGPHRISAAGGEATPIAINPGQASKGWLPSFLPDGRHFLFVAQAPSQPEKAAVYVASLDSSTPKRLFSSRSNAVYAPPGYLIFWREATLLAQPFDARTLELGGNPVPVATAVGLNPVTAQSLSSVSNSGTLVFFSGAVGQTELLWVDRAGKRIGEPGPRGLFNSLSLSPNGRNVVFDEADSRTGSFDLWLLDFARNAPSRLTFHPAHDLFPLWSPDGKRIAFTSLREGRPQLYELSVNSPGSEKVLLRSDLPNSPSDWSGDGHLLIYGVTDPKNSGDIWALPLVGKPEPFAVVATAADERYGTLSPNGRWLAYISNETGRYEVYVRAFPTSEARHQVSMSGGFEPCWRRDGKELLYLGPDQTMMSAEVETNAATFRLGPPKPLFATRTKSIEIQQGARHYAVAADGLRFLIAAATEEAQTTGITVVLNWTAALRK